MADVFSVKDHTWARVDAAVADAILAGDVVLPDGLDLDDAIDDCERALFGRVVSR